MEPGVFSTYVMTRTESNQCEFYNAFLLNWKTNKTTMFSFELIFVVNWLLLSVTRETEMETSRGPTDQTSLGWQRAQFVVENFNWSWLAIPLCVLRTRRLNYFLACGKLQWSPRRPSLLSAEPIFVFWPRLWFQSDFHWLPFASTDPRTSNRPLSEYTVTCIRLLLPHPPFISSLFTPIFTQ